jgi:hypothetical protein
MMANPMESYSLAERKLVYRVLHRHLTEHSELIDGDFLHDLQAELQRAARLENVDVSDHGAWDAWLGNQPVACAVRVADRQTFTK